MLWQVLLMFLTPKQYYKFPKWSILSHAASIFIFNSMLLLQPQALQDCSDYPTSFLIFLFSLYFLVRVWTHPSNNSPVRFSSMWEENTAFSNILAKCTNYSGNRCVIPINICIFPSCLLNSSHPSQHICQAWTCCNVCCKETTLGKSGIHRSWLSDEGTNTVSAVKQFCDKNITLQVADLQVLDKIHII